MTDTQTTDSRPYRAVLFTDGLIEVYDNQGRLLPKYSGTFNARRDTLALVYAGAVFYVDRVFGDLRLMGPFEWTQTTWVDVPDIWDRIVRPTT